MRSELSEFNKDILIYPVFVKEAEHIREPIPSMPGIFRFSPDTVLPEIESVKMAGIRRILLFGLPKIKDEYAGAAYKKGNIVSKTVTLIKKHIPDITVMTDICLCAYTTHGHCGVLKRPQEIDRPATLPLLAKMAVSHAAAGADYVAPSAMQAGQVGAIRKALDKNGYRQTRIMGYSAKFASQFYGPFRDAADSAPRFGRRTYQLNYNDKETVFKRIKDDIDEGADIIMVKPALAYLDIVHQVKKMFGYPLAVYNVSGEYAMVKAGVQAGNWKEKEMVLEIVSGIRRAGADLIITYHARKLAQWMDNKKPEQRED